MCTKPHLIRDKVHGVYIEVPCRMCMDCRLKYTKEWAMRICNEAQSYDDNCFLTLTFNDENLPNDNSIHKRDLQLFVKRLRKYLGNKRIRYFGCGEYGGKFGRPHYHIIIFNWYPDDAYYDNTCFKWRSPALENLWSFGFSTIGDVTFNSARYVASYVVKQKKGKQKDYYLEKGIEPEFVIMSNGIGKAYCLKNAEQFKKLGYIPFNGMKSALPRYYEDKLFINENERKQRNEYKLSALEKARKIFEESLNFDDYRTFSASREKQIGHGVERKVWVGYKYFKSQQNREQGLINKVERKRK